jgi:hypothetical protein
MDNKIEQKELKSLQKLYALEPDSVKWVPEGGELLQYVGQRVVYLDFEKKEDNSWQPKGIQEAIILEINDYDSKSMTYHIKYKLGETVLEERIIPEGFNAEFTQGDKKDKLNRFIPYSTHFKLMENELLYVRLRKLFNERDTLEISELMNLNSSKEQTRELLYTRNIGAIIESADDNKTIMYFRITRLKFYHHLNQPSQLVIYDDIHQKSFAVSLEDEDAEYNLKYKGEEIGKLKLIDLQS